MVKDFEFQRLEGKQVYYLNMIFPHMRLWNIGLQAYKNVKYFTHEHIFARSIFVFVLKDNDEVGYVVLLNCQNKLEQVSKELYMKYEYKCYIVHDDLDTKKLIVLLNVMNLY